MPTYNPPYKIKQRNDPWLLTYKQTIESLANLGMKFPNKSRLDIFRLWTKVSSLEDSNEKFACLELLDRLKELMVRGLEHEHKNGQYT